MPANRDRPAGPETRRVTAAVLLLAVVGAGSTDGPAASARQAAPTCSLLLNEKVQLDTPDHLTVTYLDQDCAASGTDTAQWGIRHRVHGLVGDFQFPAGTTRSVWTVTDATPLGTYDVVPGGAFDQDAAGGSTTVPQNTLHPSVRLRSWLTLGARRSGKYVVLHGLATRWSRAADARVPWRQHRVRFWFRTCRLCPSHEMKQRTTNDAGRFSFRVHSPKVRRWSARTEDQPYTWGARIVGNPADRIA